MRWPAGGYGIRPCKLPFTLRQHRTIPALRLKHRFGGSGTASALPKCSIMSGCGTRIVLRGQKPLALCDRCPCFGSLYPPLAALTFAAQSIICAFGLASAAPRLPYRHLELCGIALDIAPALPILRQGFFRGAAIKRGAPTKWRLPQRNPCAKNLNPAQNPPATAGRDPRRHLLPGGGLG